MGVFVFDDAGRYVAVNAYGCELLGYERSELLERQLGDFAAAPDVALHAYRQVADGGADEGVTRVVRPDGTELELRFRGRETTIAGLGFYIGIAWPA